MNKLIRILLILVVLGVAGAGIAWKLQENKAEITAKAEAAQVRNTAVLVTTTQAERKSLGGDFQLTGALKPAKELAIMSEVSGRLTQVNFSNGSQVSAGKVLAAVDNDLIRKQIEIAKVNLTKAIRDTERLSNLAAGGGVPQQQLEDARNSVENLQAQVATLEKQLSMTNILAPFGGIITNKSVEPGAFVNPGVKLADLVQINTMYMQIYAVESQLPLIKVGQTAKISMDLFPDQTLNGRVSFIDVKADPSQRFLVELEVNNPGQLRAGMNGSVSFVRPASAPVLTLPRSCIVGSLRDGHVYVLEGNKVAYRAVQTGTISNDFVEIKSGITEQDIIVLSGQINLSDGAEVTIKK